MMKMTIDRLAGMGYLCLTEIDKGEVEEQVYFKEKGLFLDFNKAGELVGIQFLTISRIPKSLLKEIEAET